MKLRVFVFAAVLPLIALAAIAQTPAEVDTSIKSPDPTFIVGPPAGQPLAGEELLSSTEKTGGLLRCPVCQGLSVSDSPASMAVNMKHQVRDLHAKGYSQEQILEYFEKAYGEFVRLQPPLRGVNWLVWLAPLFALAAGGAIFWWVYRRPRTPGEPGEEEIADPTHSIEIDPELEPYLERVRELAYGSSASNRE